ncbi:alpha/beta fold hydrolase [Streptomyces sp. NPDC017202]|uniref:alpha/beta fold hydrolase n=1 Tax=Streptomyces sp. NPDC017202 TaxID=3364981 RepID=UPI0037A2F99E
MSRQTLDLTHRTVPSPAGRIHLVEQGTGPLVLLVHGFPESWYSWRHQLPALAAAGHRAVALDVRGYGRSSRAAAPEAYRMRELVEDNAAVVRALGEEHAVVVGHDWGSSVAAHSALLRPHVFRAVGLLGVPYTPWRGLRADGGRAGGVLRLLLPGARPGRGRDRARRTRLARRVLRGPVRRHHARPRRAEPVLRAPRWPDARPLPRRPAARLAHRGGTRPLRGGVRADRAERGAGPLPERGPGLGGPRRPRRRPRRPAVPVRRRSPGRLHHLARRRDRRPRHHPARPGLLPPARRLRPLDPAGAARGGQPHPRRVARRPPGLSPGRPPDRAGSLRELPATHRNP